MSPRFPSLLLLRCCPPPSPCNAISVFVFITSIVSLYLRRYVGAGYNIPVVGFSTTSYALTDLAGAPSNTFFRTCQSDATTATAIYKAMNILGFQMFNILYVHDSFGRTFFELLQGCTDDGNPPFYSVCVCMYLSARDCSSAGRRICV